MVKANGKKAKGASKGASRMTGMLAAMGKLPGARSELKFFDTANSFTFDTTGEVPATGQLNLIPQGVTESTRVGRLCVLKSIQLRGEFVFSPGAAALAATTVYMYLVLDTQCNGAAAAITDVLTSNVLATALINLNNSQRFRILKRWVQPLVSSAGVTTAYNQVVVPLDYFKKIDVPLDFSSTAGAISEIRSNNLFLLAGSDGQSDDTVTFIGTTRVRFGDGS